jgi:hypothetical protein
LEDGLRRCCISAEYELPLETYSASGSIPYSQAIQATSSSDSLTVQAVTQKAAGRSSEAALVIRSGEVFRPEIGTIIIQGSQGLEHKVPRVEIAARVTRNPWQSAAGSRIRHQLHVAARGDRSSLEAGPRRRVVKRFPNRGRYDHIELEVGVLVV